MSRSQVELGLSVGEGDGAVEEQKSCDFNIRVSSLTSIDFEVGPPLNLYQFLRGPYLPPDAEVQLGIVYP